VTLAVVVAFLPALSVTSSKTMKVPGPVYV
jgi:hypothetical protein